MESTEVTPALQDLTARVGAIRIVKGVPGQLPTCEEIAATLGAVERVEPVTVPADWPSEEEPTENQGDHVVLVPVHRK